jgi:hypothetical protein
VNKRMEVEACIGMLVRLIEDESELDDICALLCAVGAACNDKALAAELLKAITPLMIASFLDMTARNN